MTTRFIYGAWEWEQEMESPPVNGDGVKVLLDCGCDREHLFSVGSRVFVLKSNDGQTLNGYIVEIELLWDDADEPGCLASPKDGV